MRELFWSLWPPYFLPRGHHELGSHIYITTVSSLLHHLWGLNCFTAVIATNGYGSMKHMTVFSIGSFKEGGVIFIWISFLSSWKSKVSWSNFLIFLSFSLQTKKRSGFLWRSPSRRPSTVKAGPPSQPRGRAQGLRTEAKTGGTMQEVMGSHPVPIYYYAL